MVRGMAIVLVLLSGCNVPPIPPYMPPEPPPKTPPPDAELLAARPYTVTVPASYDGGVALPLLIALHGYGGSPKDITDYYSLDRYADSKDLFLIAPQGLRDDLGAASWSVGHSHFPNWDRSYLSAVIRDAKSRFAIDASRVFVFGASQGAHMAYRMGCDDAEQVSVALVVAGQAPIDGSCTPTRPVSVLHMHGTNDEAIGYYGDVQNYPPNPRIPSAAASVAQWAKVDGCTGMLALDPSSPIDVSLTIAGAETRVEAYTGCPPGIDVTFWTMNDVAHRPEPNSTFTVRMLNYALAHPRP